MPVVSNGTSRSSASLRRLRALDEAQPHHQHFLDRSFRRYFGRFFKLGAALYRIEPSLGGAALLCGNFAAAAGHTTMRAGADAEVILVTPIRQIVPTLAARPRVVRDFIGRQPGGGETLAGQALATDEPRGRTRKSQEGRPRFRG